jgi:hypothetical protein
VEQPIRERVVLQPSNRGFRVIAHATEHVMPLEDLVENDAVHEAPEADPDKDSWCSWAGNGLVGLPAVAPLSRDGHWGEDSPPAWPGNLRR